LRIADCGLRIDGSWMGDWDCGRLIVFADCGLLNAD
jgi:hypothetical protein